MSGADPARGACRTAVAPLRAAPAQGAEQVSQLLLGETFAVAGEAETGEWLSVVADADGYRGWLRSWYAIALDPDRYARWQGSVIARIACRTETLRSRASTGAEARMQLPWGARVAVLRDQGRWREVELPDGRTGFVPRRSVALGEAPGGAATPRRLVRTGERFLGVPYAWGGRSAWGFDCSGFIQALFAWHGVQLPRDSTQQMEYVRGRSVPGRRREGADVVRAGELVFFGPHGDRATHVALAAADGRFLHCQGEVRWSSFSESSELFDKKLVSMFLGAWRAPREAGPGGGRKRETA